MTIFQAFVLGLVQGLTEFLPVSSSGHLVLLQNLFNIDLGGIDMFFDIMLHLGTLIAVCAVFYKQILALFKKPFKLLLYLVVATIPAALAGIIFGDLIEQVFFGGAYLAAGFALSAVLLTAAQIKAKRGEGLPLKLRHAGAMGIAQAVAVLPAISRSGATVAAGILSGGQRQQVADFSFLMSIPVILGGFIVTLFKGIYSGELTQTFNMAGGAVFGISVAVSVAAAAVSGFIAIKIMLKAISAGKYTPFIIYLAALAILCVILKFYGII